MRWKIAGYAFWALAYILLIIALFLCSCEKPVKLSPTDYLIGKWGTVTEVRMRHRGEVAFFHQRLELNLKTNNEYVFTALLIETGEYAWWEKGRWIRVGYGLDDNKGKLFFCINECSQREWIGYGYSYEYELNGDFLVLGKRVFTRR